MKSFWSSTLSRCLPPLRRIVVVALAAVVAFSMAACSGTTSNNVTDAALTGLIKPLGALLS